jgi:hypothetical protein
MAFSILEQAVNRDLSAAGQQSSGTSHRFDTGTPMRLLQYSFTLWFPSSSTTSVSPSIWLE